MAVITISRQFGSGGNAIAARVGELLGYPLLDRALMAEVANEVGLAPGEVVDFSEANHQVRSVLNRLLIRQPKVAEVRTWTEDTQGVRQAEVEALSEEQAVNIVRGVIDAVARRGNVVIVGRGSQAILREQPNTLHVRVEAPFEQRMQRVQEEEDVLPMRAERMIDERDRASQDYLRRFYGVDIWDPRHYHLVINTGRLDLETAAQVIVVAAQQMKPVPKVESPYMPVPRAMMFG
jgi:cytidylate kinase